MRIPWLLALVLIVPPVLVAGFGCAAGSRTAPAEPGNRVQWFIGSDFDPETVTVVDAEKRTFRVGEPVRVGVVVSGHVGERVEVSLWSKANPAGVMTLIDRVQEAHAEGDARVYTDGIVLTVDEPTEYVVACRVGPYVARQTITVEPE